MTSHVARARPTRSQIGQAYLGGTFVAFLAVALVAGGIMTAVISTAHWSRAGQVQGTAQTAITTVNTDLQAATMYDPTAASKLGALTSGTWSVPAPAVTPQPWYIASDKQPVVFQLQTANSTTINFKYSLSPTGTGTIAVPIIQKAPNGCDPSLPSSDCGAQ